MSTIAVILAGGKSARMGQDKALLNIGNKTLLRHMQMILAQTSVDKVLVNQNNKQHKELRDIIPHKGPLSGIHSAAIQYPEHNLLIVPVDLPLIDATTLQPLLEHGEKQQINTRFSHHNLPLFLINSTKLCEKLDYTLRFTNHYSVGRLCSHFPLSEMHLRKQSRLFNSNTPAQWRFALQHFPDTWEPAIHEDFYESFQ